MDTFRNLDNICGIVIVSRTKQRSNNIGQSSIHQTPEKSYGKDIKNQWYTAYFSKTQNNCFSKWVILFVCKSGTFMVLKIFILYCIGCISQENLGFVTILSSCNYFSNIDWGLSW